MTLCSLVVGRLQSVATTNGEATESHPQHQALNWLLWLTVTCFDGKKTNWFGAEYRLPHPDQWVCRVAGYPSEQ